MSEQIDIAVDLGVVAAALPEIESMREFADRPEAVPAELIDGTLQGYGRSGPARPRLRRGKGWAVNRTG